MHIISVVEPLENEIVIRVAECSRVMTPALVIDHDNLRHNIATTLRLLGGDTGRWRPHVKTAKLGYVVRLLVEAGVRHFKCATSLELKVACEAGANDVLVAYPMIGPNAARIARIADEHPNVAISVLVENVSHIRQWQGAKVGLFIDVNPGMNRTGVSQERLEPIMNLSKAIVSSGLRFCGLHYYDGHLSQQCMKERCEHAHGGYNHLLQIVYALGAQGIEVFEVITAGTPTFPCSLSFEQFSGATFIHRLSPGTLIYCDATSLRQLPPEYGYLPAAVVMTRVVSHPAKGIITCDAGHKTVSADAGIPTCVVLGHRGFEPLAPSEEHLPIRVAEDIAVPSIGDVLYLVPRHVCPTVNNFDHALIIKAHSVIAVESVSARGRERPI